MDLHPCFTGPQPPAPTPVCGVSLPSIPSRPPCDEPAAWHVLWEAGLRPGASLACARHMAEYAEHHTWWERHRTAAACSTPSPTWHPDHCTVD